jgi:hypothetical protein
MGQARVKAKITQQGKDYMEGLLASTPLLKEALGEFRFAYAAADKSLLVFPIELVPIVRGMYGFSEKLPDAERIKLLETAAPYNMLKVCKGLKQANYVGEIQVFQNATHLLTLIEIPGITRIGIRAVFDHTHQSKYDTLTAILNKYVGHPEQILECLEELIDAGFIDQARLKEKQNND